MSFRPRAVTDKLDARLQEEMLSEEKLFLYC